VAGLSVSYSGGPAIFGVAIIEFDGMLVRRERIYGGEPWTPRSGTDPGAQAPADA
jgi:hypothetical protein